MGICKNVRLNVKGYRTYLNEKIRIYQNDSFKLRFIIEYCGIQTEQILKNKGLNISNLTATLFIETPNEIDTLEQAEVVSDMIEFNLTNKYTQHIGTSRMQIQLKDDDDCIYTLPEFTFEVKKNIYDATEIQNVTLIDEEDNNVIDEYDNRILVEHSVSLVEGYKQIKDFALKSEVVGTEDLLIQDNGVTKRIKTGSIKGTQDLTSYYTKEEINSKLSAKSNATHNHDTVYASKNTEHIHTNKTTLDKITDGKLTEWDNKSEFDGDYTTLKNKPAIPSLEGYASETFVTTKIAEAQLDGGNVDLSGYATKEDLNFKVDTVTGKGLSTNDFTNEEKSKLETLNNYTHPETHEATTIVQDETHRFVTDNDKASWDNKSDFNGDYNSLMNKPTLLKGDKGDKGDRGEQGLKGEKGEQGIVDYSNIYNKQEVDSKISKAIDLSEYYTKEESDIKLDSKANANHNHDDTYATKSSEHIHANKTILDEITDEKMMSWDNKSDFNGSYDALTNKPTLLKGDKGDVGATPNLTIGTVETLLPSQPASVTITGTEANPILNFGIPKGKDGQGGGGSGGGGGKKLIARYVHKSNKVAQPTSLDLESGIFTCENHGLNSNTKLMINIDTKKFTTIRSVPKELFLKIASSTWSYFTPEVIDENHFKLKDVSYDISANTQVDVSKFWFEEIGVDVIKITGLSPSNQAQIITKGLHTNENGMCVAWLANEVFSPYLYSPMNYTNKVDLIPFTVEHTFAKRGLNLLCITDTVIHNGFAKTNVTKSFIEIIESKHKDSWNVDNSFYSFTQEILDDLAFKDSFVLDVTGRQNIRNGFTIEIYDLGVAE